MHGQVGAAFLHRDFEFLDEQALAADRRQRLVEDLVALRRHAEDIDLALRIQCGETALHMDGLPHGKRRLTGSDDDAGGRGR